MKSTRSSKPTKKMANPLLRTLVSWQAYARSRFQRRRICRLRRTPTNNPKNHSSSERAAQSNLIGRHDGDIGITLKVLYVCGKDMGYAVDHHGRDQTGVMDVHATHFVSQYKRLPLFIDGRAVG